MTTDRVILWDFDGTLAERPGGWRGMLVAILDELEPGHGFDTIRLAAGLTAGYPWDDWQRPHPELCQADAWWDFVCAMLGRGMAQVGVPKALAETAAARVRFEYTVLNRWRRYPDAIPALEMARAHGWRNVILSNHCPELPALVEGLGLSAQIDRVFNSAVTGYEKPHPLAFRTALAALAGESAAPPRVAMIGDNAHADIEGAAACGIDGILVRREVPGLRCAPTLVDAVSLLVAGGAVVDRGPIAGRGPPSARRPYLPWSACWVAASAGLGS